MANDFGAEYLETENGGTLFGATYQKCWMDPYGSGYMICRGGGGYFIAE